MKILQEISSQQPGRSFLPEHNHSSILILDFWFIELWRIWFLLFISHLICGTLWKQPDIYMCTSLSHLYISTYISHIYVYLWIYTFMHIYTYLPLCVCIYMCIYVCIYIYIHIYIYTPTHSHQCFQFQTKATRFILVFFLSKILAPISTSETLDSHHTIFSYGSTSLCVTNLRPYWPPLHRGSPNPVRPGYPTSGHSPSDTLCQLAPQGKFPSPSKSDILIRVSHVLPYLIN